MSVIVNIIYLDRIHMFYSYLLFFYGGIKYFFSTFDIKKPEEKSIKNGGKEQF
jgi:hypothetical protein